MNYDYIYKFSKNLDLCKKKNNIILPLIDKYRPKNFKSIILNDIIKNKISTIIELNIIPNLMIIGPSGTGKTSLIRILSKKLLGKKYSDGVLNLNASDNRGLDYLNNTIIYFCKKKLVDNNGNIIPKMIIMDEADNITKKAQNMIANLIEEYGKHTRFAFTCNESSKLIESIQSRCLIIYIAPLKTNLIVEHLEKICLLENISYDADGLELIAKNSKGDLRASINILDAINNGFSNIIIDNIIKLSYEPCPKKIIRLIQECANREFYKCINIIDELRFEGYCGSDILLIMIKILKEVDIDEEIRMKYLNIISEYYSKISDGLDTKLQLYGCISKIILL